MATEIRRLRANTVMCTVQGCGQVAEFFLAWIDANADSRSIPAAYCETHAQDAAKRLGQQLRPIAERKAPAQPQRVFPWQPTDPAWEAMKASTRNLSHDAAVLECARLSTLYRRMCCSTSKVLIDFDQVLQTVRTRRIPFVLTGAHGISGWTGRPRATRDVDILVKSGRNYARAVNVIREL